MEWNFKREEHEFAQIPVGDYRVVIKSVEKAVSKAAGNDMLALQFEVSGQSSILYHYIVFLTDRPEITNRNLTALFDSFGIADGDFNINGWVGRGGAVRVKHDDEGKAKISYFIKKEKQDDMPPFVKKSATSGESPKAVVAEVEDDDDLPF